MTEIITYSPDETKDLGRKIGADLQKPMVLALTGHLGSGKTVFVQGLAAGLEVPENYYITSPTYTLINDYPGRLHLYHADLYRLSTGETTDIGLEDLLENSGVIAIEWADRLPPGMLQTALEIRFEVMEDWSRRIKY